MSSHGSASQLFTFLSTPSARRATFDTIARATYGNISIHALREEGDCVMDGRLQDLRISIHALREEGDGRCCTGR